MLHFIPKLYFVFHHATLWFTFSHFTFLSCDSHFHILIHIFPLHITTFGIHIFYSHNMFHILCFTFYALHFMLHILCFTFYASHFSGLEVDDLEVLSQAKQAVKASRRDLAVALARVNTKIRDPGVFFAVFVCGVGAGSLCCFCSF